MGQAKVEQQRVALLEGGRDRYARAVRALPLPAAAEVCVLRVPVRERDKLGGSQFRCQRYQRDHYVDRMAGGCCLDRARRAQVGQLRVRDLAARGVEVAAVAVPRLPIGARLGDNDARGQEPHRRRAVRAAACL